ncbi:hypothetical protein KAH81_07475 [bacterium]|nr:hypothetical protein [bacterium]
MLRISKTTYSILAIAVLIMAMLNGCGYQGEQNTNIDPIVILYNNPIDGDTLGAAPIICWQGFDTDGKVYDYEYIDLPKQQTGSDQGVPDSVFNALKDDPTLLAQQTFVLNQSGDSIFWTETDANCDTIFLSLLVQDELTEHLFCVRALDYEGANSDIQCGTFYRSNLPPDTCEITTEDFDGGEFWCLDDTTYSWDGIKVSWRGTDPDNSILLEYKWFLENTADNVIALSSLSEDSIGGVISGFDEYDGWIRNTSTMMKGNVPTGEYRFIIQVRDDAFYSGVADTAIIQIAHPSFDISRESVLEQYADGTYPNHKVLLIDQNESWFYMFDDLSNVRQYYTDVLQGLKSDGIIADWDSVTSGYADLEVDRTVLSEYNILYILDQDGSYNFKMDEGFLNEIMEYIKVGGRIIVDGRDCFNKESDSWAFVPSYNFFGIAEDFGEGYARAIFSYGSRNTSLPASEYPDLVIDSSLVPDGQIPYVKRLGSRPPSYGGSPYTQILYNFGLSATADAMDSTNYGGGPIAVRYVTPSYRTAYFGFPLYLMDDSEDQVKTVIRSTIEFIKAQVIPPDEEEE